MDDLSITVDDFLKNNKKLEDKATGQTAPIKKQAQLNMNEVRNVKENLWYSPHRFHGLDIG